jgi:hypothetical protein
MEKTFEQELNARASAGEEHVSFEADATQLAVPKANVLKFDHDMVTDEVNITKAEEVNKTLNELAASMAFEAPAEQIVACACDTCLEENADALTLGSEDNVSTDADIDLGLIVADLSERLAKLEQRIVEYNVRSSHKI